MALAQFISTQYVKDNSPLHDNVDDKIIKASILAVQDTAVHSLLGSDLYDKLEADIVADTLTGNYETLLVRFIKPFMLNLVCEELVVTNSLQMRNKAVLKNNSEDALNVDLSELKLLSDVFSTRAQAYEQRLLDYICRVGFDEYMQNDDDEDLRGTKNNSVQFGIYLGGGADRCKDKKYS